ncbi:hypothetical protein ACFSCV_04290 [Methylopila henanensis]|uniref:Uncharacterized protein n=1 Tax=Methylopila henanensis TaxID=873516 RepID=A0ABW4K528_9HYPH
MTESSKTVEPPSRRRRFLSRVAAGVGGFAAAAAATVAAVHDARTPKAAPAVAPGAAIETGRWRVSASNARVIAETPDGLRLLNGKTAFAADLALENLTSVTSNAFYRLVALKDPPAGVDPKPSFYLARDGALLWSLHPRMAETVTAVWTLPPGVAPPREARLAVTGETFKPKDNLYAAPGWFDPKVVAEVTLPVAGGEAAR